MSPFTRKKIDQTNRVCLRLKEAREHAGLSVEQMSVKTRLSKAYILALESCDFEKLPKGDVYQKNFIKRYLDVLNIPCTSYIQQFLIEESYDRQPAQPTSQRVHPHKSQSTIRLRALPDLMKYVSVGLLFLGIFGYLGWQVNRILEPPMLVLASPDDGHITSDEHVTIRGTVDPETHITINGKAVSIAQEGQFEQNLDLVEGLNTIVVSATKKHGKSTTQTRYVTQRPIQKVTVDTSHDSNS
jgi:cytoskeletal protein RodZ